MDKWFVAGAVFDRQGNYLGDVAKEVHADDWGDARDKAWEQIQKVYPQVDVIVYNATHKKG